MKLHLMIVIQVSMRKPVAQFRFQSNKMDFGMHECSIYIWCVWNKLMHVCATELLIVQSMKCRTQLNSIFQPQVFWAPFTNGTM